MKTRGSQAGNKRARPGKESEGNGAMVVAPPEPVEQQSGDVPTTMEGALTRLQTIVEEPEIFLTRPPELAKLLMSTLKVLYDHAKQTEPVKLGQLKELITEGFDSETVWQQLELRNPAVKTFIKRVTQRLSELAENGEWAEDREEQREDEEDEDGMMDDEDDDEDDDDDDDEEEDDEDEEEEDEGEEEEDEEMERLPIRGKLKLPRKEDEEGDEENELEKEDRAFREGEGGDRFFDWDEMERIGDEADEEMMRMQEEEAEGMGDDNDEDDDEDEEEGDEDEDDEEEDEAAKKIKYDDFFDDEDEDGEEGDEMMDQDEGEEDEDGEDGEEEEEEEEDESALTAFQRDQRMRRREIEEREAELVAERPWELRGEVSARDRPENSLLEAVVDVERASRPAVQMTAEKSATIEDMIKARIAEERFDDVIPKDITEEALMNRRPRDDLPEVSQEKSKEGLGDIYEREYMRLALGVEGESAESKEKQEMAALFRKLCHKLDALSNFHFAPKAPVVDMSVQPNVPAIAMEEVLPLAVSSALAQAPEEVYEKKKGKEGVLRDAAELTQDDRKRLRRDKKSARRKSRAQKAAVEKLIDRVKPGLGNKYSKEKLRQELQRSGKVTEGKVSQEQTKAFSKSTKFFKGLQEEVTQHGGAYAKTKPGAKSDEKRAPSASLKL